MLFLFHLRSQDTCRTDNVWKSGSQSCASVTFDGRAQVVLEFGNNCDKIFRPTRREYVDREAKNG